MVTSGLTAASDIAKLSSDQALKVARSDAERAYRDLSGYRITISLEDKGWRIDYEVKDPVLQGGGRHYIIGSVTGAILEKRYEQ